MGIERWKELSKFLHEHPGMSLAEIEATAKDFVGEDAAKMLVAYIKGVN